MIEIEDSIRKWKLILNIKIWKFDDILIDINECTMNMSRCDENANCSNTDGSYNCPCNHGYEGDRFNCTGKNMKIVYGFSSWKWLLKIL